MSADKPGFHSTLSMISLSPLEYFPSLMFMFNDESLFKVAAISLSDFFF